ncbi:hypothetical protein EVAR_100031_1 [Eumeta japonica]|uniref:Uncharacterized protein n=1 Tax=Eumeta variegata TaxID=151549 RepID=A0A4C1SMR4_EUMVA|nr:hypothetical protein EVAR_100031_1 [Eumeta japonica]
MLSVSKAVTASDRTVANGPRSSLGQRESIYKITSEQSRTSGALKLTEQCFTYWIGNGCRRLRTAAVTSRPPAPHKSRPSTRQGAGAGGAGVARSALTSYLERN